jgi:S-adenosyl-L-methionine hydrolase (adenosine-forming)
MARRITLLTDFGTADGYVAAMKGVIAQIAPAVIVDDASHAIPHGDARSAAYALQRYWRLYPPGTVHIVVVDPGVGSERNAIVVSADERTLVGPDNGVFTVVLRDAQRWSVYVADNPSFFRESTSNTFHGRDVFAPVGAHLALGRAVSECGAQIDNPLRLELPAAVTEGERVRGEIVYVDHFGNLISNIPATLIAPEMRVRLGTHHLLRISRTYSDANAGSAVALINSDDVLEIAVRDGSATRYFSIGRGASVELIPAK